MIRRMIMPALFGLIGTAVLVALGVWQLDRAGQKAALVADMESRLVGRPPRLPASRPEADNYRPVQLEGTFLPAQTFVLSGVKGKGPGFRVIGAFQTEGGRTVLVDRGFLPEARRATCPRLPAHPHPGRKPAMAARY